MSYILLVREKENYEYSYVYALNGLMILCTISFELL